MFPFTFIIAILVYTRIVDGEGESWLKACS